MQKSNGVKIRKLPLPLEIRFGSDATITDGLFSLSGKEASSIRIIDIDDEKYATVEIYPAKKDETQILKISFVEDTFLGSDLSKSIGLGKDFGRYKYYKRKDGSIYAVVNGQKRTRKLQLGNPRERDSPIAIIARTICLNFPNEFSKKQITQVLPKKLGYGQTLKAVLDTLTFEGYIEKKQGTTRGRLRETFKSTAKLNDLIVTPEQA
jgi:hypothetical protein